MTVNSIYAELNIRANDGDEKQEQAQDHDQSGSSRSDNDILFGV